MAVTRAEVEKIAGLARLELTGEECALYQKQLSSILDWMEELKGADTSSVEPLAHVFGTENVMRDDVPVRHEDRKSLLDNAPMREFDFVKVRKVIE